MRGPSHKIGITLQRVFVSRKLEQDLKPREIKPSIVNQQCDVRLLTCNNLFITYYMLKKIKPPSTRNTVQSKYKS